MITSILVMTMVFMAGLAGEFQLSFQRHALESLSLAAQASVLQEKSVVDEAESAQQQEAATVDFEYAETKEATSQQLKYASERDQEVATAEMGRYEELQAQALVEEDSASIHAAAATAAQDVAVESMEAAGTDEVAAARWEAAAAEDGWTVTLCQMIPLLDVACDVIGGTTLLFAEAAGTESAAKAAMEWTAAVTATHEREREETLAAESEQSAVAQQEQAMLAKEQANAAKIRAEEEAAEAEALELQSQEAKEKAVAEEATAQELSLEAATEESTSLELWQQSIVIGVHACWDAIVTIIMAAGALVLGAVTFISSISQKIFTVCSSRASTACLSTPVNHVDKIAEYKRQPRSFQTNLLQHFSFLWHHAAIFLLSINFGGIVKPWMEQFPQLDCRHRGEAIIRFALVAALLQTCALHAIPYAIGSWLHRLHQSKLVLCIDVCLNVSIHTFFWTTWRVLEFLILWTIWKPFLLTILSFSTLHEAWLPAILAFCLCITATLHAYLVDKYSSNPVDRGEKCHENKAEQVTYEDPEEWESITEASLLLPSDKFGSFAEKKCISLQEVTVQNFQSLVSFLKILKYPLEMLVCTCMVMILQHCTPLLYKVWPFSKSNLFTHAPRWVRPCAIVLSVMGVLTFFMIVVREFWQCWKRRRCRTERTIDTDLLLSVT